MKFLFLEPFFGGSHKSFAQGLVAHSKHDIDLFTMPGEFWKWRMEGAALYFKKKIPPLEKYDGLIVTDLMSLSDFRAISGPCFPPALLYFHENQLTYPDDVYKKQDYQFGCIDITSALSADRVLFNSKTHLDSFTAVLKSFINRAPDFKPEWVIDEIITKADVLHPGCDFPAKREPLETLDADLPLVIWNHRWGFDKNAGAFFFAIDKIAGQGIDFHLALLGENFDRIPDIFADAKEKHKERIVQYGYAASQEEYCNILKRGHIVVSTANQENFGISIVEAIRFGCVPLLPDRLSYPEILPETYHEALLYSDRQELFRKLKYAILNYNEFASERDSLSQEMGRFAWKRIVKKYDKELDDLVCK
ncbi:MAG: DUF3524 domain-containing protein [Desulfobacterales bacterium]|nr:DUF3524 domain-containing protein [Desulfobacterales bacterium]